LELLYDKRHISNVFFGILIILGLLLLVYLIRPVLGALGITMVLTYFLNPVVTAIQPRVKGRWIAIMVTAFFILAPLFVFFVLLTTTLVSQVLELTKTPQMKELLDLVGENYKVYLVPPPPEFVSQVSIATLTAYRDIFTQGFGAAVNFLSAVGGVFLQVILGMFFTVYMLFKVEGIQRFFDSLEDHKVRQFILFVHEGLQQIVFSMFFTAIITGAIATVIYAAFGIPVFVLLGFLTGIVALIPVLGCWLVYGPIALYILSLEGTEPAIFFLGLSLVFISTLPDMVIRPYIASKRVNTGLLVLGFICGVLVFGPTGVLLGPLIIISWVGFVRIFVVGEVPSEDQ
jgi:predicted PurR-regulated permease PerM